MNLPNRLTILRVLMIPVFLIVYLNKWFPYHNEIALAIFIIASFTDFLDGYIARKKKMVTNFGKFMDPLADKLLVCSALICFLVIPGNPMPVWVVIIIISREFIISGLRLVASDAGIVIAAGYWGKIKTVVQMFMAMFLIVNYDFAIVNIIEWILIYASVILTIISLIDYIYQNRKVFQEGL